MPSSIWPGPENAWPLVVGGCTEPSWRRRPSAGKLADLSMALTGRFTGHHAALCRLHLDRIAVFDDAVDGLDDRLAGLSHTFQAVALPDIQRPPEQGESWMRFVQTAGGRTAVPMPRPVRRRPFVQWQSPLVWTTLSLTLHADGRAEYAVAGASPFPRHWIYDSGGRLAHKSGLTDYANWTRESFGRHSPWGDEDSPALVTAVETALEQALSVQLMQGGARPRISQLEPGAGLVRQGDFGQDIYLVLDGVIRVERDGNQLAEYGPGAMLGERAVLEGGTRTSTLVAVTRCRVASIPAVQPDLSDLAELATGHRREEGVRG